MIRFALGRWAVQLDRAGLVILDRVEHRARRRRARLAGRRLGLNVQPGPLAGFGGGAVPPGSLNLTPDAVAMLGAAHRPERVGFSAETVRQAHELGRRGRPLRG